MNCVWSRLVEFGFICKFCLKGISCFLFLSFNCQPSPSFVHGRSEFPVSRSDPLREVPSYGWHASPCFARVLASAINATINVVVSVRVQTPSCFNRQLARSPFLRICNIQHRWFHSSPRSVLCSRALVGKVVPASTIRFWCHLYFFTFDFMYTQVQPKFSWCGDWAQVHHFPDSVIRV